MKRALFIILFAVFSFCGAAQAQVQLNMPEAEYQASVTALVQSLVTDHGLAPSSQAPVEARLQAFYLDCVNHHTALQQAVTNGDAELALDLRENGQGRVYDAMFDDIKAHLNNDQVLVIIRSRILDIIEL